MMDGYVVKIVWPAGYRVLRLHFTRAHLFTFVIASIVAVGAIGGYSVWVVRHAAAKVEQLRTLTERQDASLRSIDAQATRIDGEVHRLQAQDAQLRKLMGVRGVATAAPASLPRRTSMLAPSFTSVASRVEGLRRAANSEIANELALRAGALRVLNMARLQTLAQAKILAAIPSINPAGAGVGIRSPFGWRVDPWPEFHEGVDLAADYGDPVRAAAAGTVVSAGYDGGYGIKIDIDHGNGYHTWYCHLSRADVQPGEHVAKAEHIALVGSTGASTGPHLHYQIMLDGKPVDPTPYLDGVPHDVVASLK